MEFIEIELIVTEEMAELLDDALLYVNDNIFNSMTNDDFLFLFHEVETGAN